MDTRFYDRYKRLMSNLNYQYLGYNIKDLIPGYLTCMFTDDPIVGRDVFKEFYKTQAVSDLSAVITSPKKTSISYLISRRDYEDLAKSVQELYPDSSVACIENLGYQKCSFFSPTYIRHLFKSLRIVFGASIKESFMTRLYLVALITAILNQVKVLDKQQCSSTIKQYICFNSAYKEESLLTAYFKKRGIETISLQHGIFCDFKDIIPFDIINMDNMISDKLMCWGKSTQDYLRSKGFDDSKFILMGNPKYKDTQITHVGQSFKKCLVLLGRSVYIPSNDRLLALLQEFNTKHNNKVLFYIKKHPFVVDAEHKQYASIANNLFFVGREHSVQEVLRSDMVDFTIAVNTTAYYESLALGKISLRWSDAENEDFYGMDDKFYDLSGLEEKIQYFQNLPEEDVRNQMKEVIEYVFKPKSE